MRSPVTFNQDGGPNHIYLSTYRNWLSAKKMTANTARAYYSRIRQFLFFLEYTHLEQALCDETAVGEAMLLYLQFLRQANKGNSTINANIDALNNFGSFLEMKVALTRVPFYRKASKRLTPAEQARFLQAAEQQELTRDRALALILFYTGLRIGDCSNLNVEQVGPGASCITFASGARIQLNECTSRSLRQWLVQRQDLSDVAGGGSALWLTSHGQRLSIPGISFVVRRIGWQAKLNLSVEMLRRTCLAKGSHGLNQDELSKKFGGILSRETLERYSMSC